MWACLVWAERSTPDKFWVPNHRCNSTTVEQKVITQTIYTDSKPASQMPNSLMPSANLRSANLPPIFYVFGVTRSGIEPQPPAPRADALTTTLSWGGYKQHVGELNNLCCTYMYIICVLSIQSGKYTNLVLSLQPRYYVSSLCVYYGECRKPKCLL